MIAAFIAGCAAPGDRQDGELDMVADGKADSGYSDAEINGALRVANELSFAELDDDVGLSSLTAQRIVEPSGPGYFGTSIAMKAGIVVVGAPSDAGGIGAVYSN